MLKKKRRKTGKSSQVYKWFHNTTLPRITTTESFACMAEHNTLRCRSDCRQKKEKYSILQLCDTKQRALTQFTVCSKNGFFFKVLKIYLTVFGKHLRAKLFRQIPPQLQTTVKRKILPITCESQLHIFQAPDDLNSALLPLAASLALTGLSFGSTHYIILATVAHALTDQKPTSVGICDTLGVF